MAPRLPLRTAVLPLALVAGFVVLAACADDAEIPTAVPNPSSDAGSDRGAAADASAIVDASPDAEGDAAPMPSGPVHGTLVDMSGFPLDGYLVATPDGGTTTTADGGAFTVDVATTAYDVLVTNPAKSRVLAVEGLTRRDPIVTIPYPEFDEHYTMVKGSIPAITAGQGAQFSFAPDRPARFASYGLVYGPASSYGQNFGWYTEGPTSGTLWLFAYTKVDSNNTAGVFLGYASTPVTLTPGVDAVNDFGALTAVATQSVHAVMNLPVGYTKGGSLFGLMRPRGSTARLAVNQATGVATTFSMPMPVIANATYMIGLRAMSGSQQSIVRRTVALGGTLTHAMPAVPPITGPDGAVDVDGTTAFGSAGGAHCFMMYPQEAGPTVFVLTAKASTHLPHLATVGITVPSGKPYQWSVVGYPDNATTDSLTATAVDVYCSSDGAVGPDDVACTISDDRSFTTK